MSDVLNTDACGRPLPPSCVPGVFNLPACYRIGAGPVLPGFQQITRNAACVITAAAILDSALTPVVGGTLVACPGSGA